MTDWNKRSLGLVIATVLILIHLTACAAWMLSLPREAKAEGAAPIEPAERQALIDALKPRRPGRPVIAIVGINDATETTDYLMPNGILRRAGVADVYALATHRGPVELYPALRVLPDATLNEFDARYPQGPDYIIVPAMSRDNDPAILAWLRKQKARGAVIIGVCAGARIVANAGLLDDRRGTTHWYYLKGMLKKHPSIRYVPDRRFVLDQGVVTTTGISASMPMMLTLVEAIGGREKAIAVARDLGVAQWDARHDSGAFKLNRNFAVGVVENSIAFWSKEGLGLPLVPGVDEVTLALRADAWSRTYRSRARTYSATAAAKRSRNGLWILPDAVDPSWPAERRLDPLGDLRPAQALDRTLAEIRQRYGSRTQKLVAMQLEYVLKEGARESGI